MNSTSFKFSRLALVALLLGFFAAAVSPQSAFAATLVLSADTFPSGERLNWARAGSTITVEIVDTNPAVNIGNVTAVVKSDEADDMLFLAPADFVEAPADTFTATFLLTAGATPTAGILRVDPKDDNVKVTYNAGNLARDFDVENEEPDTMCRTECRELSAIRQAPCLVQGFVMRCERIHSNEPPMHW